MGNRQNNTLILNTHRLQTAHDFSEYFENKKYKVEIIHGHDDVIDMGYGRKHPFKSFMGQKRIGTKPRESSLNGELAKK